VSPRALLVVALCGGCYPWVGGTWDDYAMPDEVQIVGSAIHTERLGGYWSSNTPWGDLWWGWLGEPVPGLTALSLLAPEGPGCFRGQPNELVVTELLADPGATASVLRGPEVFELPYNGTQSRFVGRVDDIPGGTYDLDPVQSDNAGVLEAYPLLSMPPGVAIDGPPMSGPTVNTGSLDALTFTWDPATLAADWFWVQAGISSLSPTGYVPYEWVVCVVPFEDGELTVPTVLWTDSERADAVYIDMGPLDERLGQVGDRAFTASSVGVRRSSGILRL